MINTGSAPTCVRNNGTSFVDVVNFATPGAAKKIHNWKVLEEEKFSDHQYISFELDPNIRPQRHTSDVVVNFACVRNAFQNIFSPDVDIPQTWDKCCEILQQAQRAGHKKRHGKSSGYWWSAEMDEAKARCNRERRACTRERRRLGYVNEDSENGRREAQRDLTNLVRRCKRLHWLGLLKRIENDIWGNAFQIVVRDTKSLNPGVTFSVGAMMEIVVVLLPTGNPLDVHPVLETKRISGPLRAMIHNYLEDRTIKV